MAEQTNQPRPVQRDDAQRARLRRLRKEGRIALVSSIALLVAGVVVYRMGSSAPTVKPTDGDGAVAMLVSAAGVLGWISLIRSIQSSVLPEQSLIEYLTDACATVISVSFAMWLINQGYKAWF